MDKDKLILDSESFKTYYKKEKRAKAILLVMASFVIIVTSLSIVLAFASPLDRLQDTTNSIENFKKNSDFHSKSTSIIETLISRSSKTSFFADFALLLPPINKTEEKVTQIAITTPKYQPLALPKTEEPKTKSQPKPASNQKPNTTTTPKPTPIKTKVVQQPKLVTKKTSTKPTTAAKPEKKTSIAGRFDNVDPIPIPAMEIRPPDANYGIPENWPINSPVSVPYGYRPERGRFHSGVDLDAEVGVPVEAAGAGKVIRAEWYAGYGMCVDIEHANGYVTRYGHLSQIYVTKGQWVEVGEWIGANGNTGNSSAPHVHFEVHQNGHSIDPEGINWTIRKMPPKAY